jgi:hypothetical protein
MVSNECKEKATKYSIHYYLLLSVTWELLEIFTFGVTFNIARLATFLSFFLNFLSCFADMLST